MPKFPVLEIDRFMKRIEFGEGGCWNWTGGLLDGYGLFWSSLINSSSAHRFNYTYFVQAIPVGLQIDHLCGNRRCSYPLHLEVVTNEENKRRARGNKNMFWKVLLQLSPGQFEVEFPNCDPETGKYL